MRPAANTREGNGQERQPSRATRIDPVNALKGE